MARDPRSNSAFSSGLRGREKPKVADSHGKNMTNDSAGSDPLSAEKQAPGKSVGEPGGVDQTDPVYSSGMRGMEKAKQKPASGAANKQAEEGSKMGGENKQGPNTIVGGPKGEQSWSSDDKGPKKGVMDEHLRSTAADAYKMGSANEGSSNGLSQAAGERGPEGEAGILGEEDDTHINVRIPKASLKRKASGFQAS